jgi:hypothetical protein
MSAVALATAARAGIAHPRTVFGLEVRSEIEIPGLREAPSGPPARAPAPAVAVELGAGAERPWASPPVMAKRAPSGTLLASFHDEPERGYRLYAHGFGSFEIARDGSRISCRPSPGAEAWRWQRFLCGQALPFVAVLHGFEPFHSAAVGLDGRAAALVGGSGSGKTTLALQLVAAGAAFCSDDVVALAPGSTEVEPAPAVANVRDGSLRARAERGAPPFGATLGSTAESVRVLIDAACERLPLGLVYFIERSAAHPTVCFTPVSDPFLLLGHTFNVLVQTPERLERQLDACARVAEAAALVRVTAPAALPAAELAALIAAHALRDQSPFEGLPAHTGSLFRSLPQTDL